MTQTIVNKRVLSPDDYDAVLSLIHLVPEGPETSLESLKWNSAMRDLLARFEHKFGRG